MYIKRIIAGLSLGVALTLAVAETDYDGTTRRNLRGSPSAIDNNEMDSSIIKEEDHERTATSPSFHQGATYQLGYMEARRFVKDARMSDDV